jgi:putative SOS response-associated peptidase YedK
MCTRMARESSIATIAARFGARGRWPECAAASLSAGDATPVVRWGARGKREIAMLRWGMLSEHPLAHGSGPLTTIAARSVDRAALLQELFPEHRCIVPVDAFHAGPVAWAKNAPVWEFRLFDDTLMGIAGLWFADRFAIITTGPNESVALIEDAMPAILYPRDEAAWLNPRTHPYKAHRLIMPYPAESMRALPIPAGKGKAPDLLHRVA